MGGARGWEIGLRLLTLAALVVAGWWLWQGRAMQAGASHALAEPARPLLLEKGTYLGPPDTAPSEEARTAWNERAQRLSF